MNLRRFILAIAGLTIYSAMFSAILGIMIASNWWISAIVSAFSFVAVAYCAFAIGTETQKKLLQIQWGKTYLFYGTPRENVFFLSAMTEISSGQQLNEDGMYDISTIKVDPKLKSGSICVLIRHPGHLDGSPYLTLYNKGEYEHNFLPAKKT